MFLDRCGSFFLKVVLLFSIMIMLDSCRKKDDDKDILRPQCEHRSIEMCIGETIQNRVLNASHIDVASVPVVVDVTVNETTLYVKGVEAGSGVVSLTADGHRLQFNVSVFDSGQENPEEDDSEKYEAELNDASARFVRGNHKLLYSNVGTIFQYKSDNNSLKIASIVTGDYTLIESTEINFIGENKIGLLNHSAIKLSISGRNVELTEVEVVKSDSQATWIHFKTVDMASAWLVLPRNFMN